MRLYVQLSFYVLLNSLLDMLLPVIQRLDQRYLHTRPHHITPHPIFLSLLSHHFTSRRLLKSFHVWLAPIKLKKIFDSFIDLTRELPSFLFLISKIPVQLLNRVLLALQQFSLLTQELLALLALESFVLLADRVFPVYLLG